MISPTVKLAFVISPTAEAQNLGQSYLAHFNNYPLSEAEVIVVIGGDGFMLHSLHQYQHLQKPIYGVNCGSVGFLMNAPDINNLIQRLSQASVSTLFPLKMIAKSLDGSTTTLYAINEVSLFRQSSQAAKIQIVIDGIVRLEELTCDGVLISTPAGSTAYNLSAHGPIIPIGTNLLALTPISPFRPRRWRGALLPGNTTVTLIVQTPEFRSVNAAADDEQVNNVSQVTISMDPGHCYKLLFDPHHNLEFRIIQEQFTF